MNLVFIYGPPAAGKLTVAKELAKATGYTIFHNHQTRDLVQQLYPNDLSEKYELVQTLRLNIFDFLARHDTNTIFTYVYDGPDDDSFVKEVVGRVEKHGGNVLFVELRPTDDVLMHRVDSDSRKEHRKLTSKELLRANLGKITYKSVSYTNILRIDNSSIEPDEVATMVVDYFDL